MTTVLRSPNCCGCPSFPNSLCPVCYRYNIGGGMRETQETISEWGVKTFGYPKNRETMVRRMLNECKELEELLGQGNFGSGYIDERVADECADIYIVMCQVMTTIGYNLHACVDHKMQINRGRKWKVKEDGTGQHIE